MEFYVQIYHGGCFKYAPKLKYEGGDIEFVDVYSDKMSLPELWYHVRRLGYAEWKDLWYRTPGCGIENGLQLLKNDTDVMKMCEKVVASSKIVDVYVEHNISEPQETLLLENVVYADYDHEAGQSTGEVNVQVCEFVDNEYVVDGDDVDDNIDYEGDVEEGGNECLSNDEESVVFEEDSDEEDADYDQADEETDEVDDEDFEEEENDVDGDCNEDSDEDLFDVNNVELHSEYGKSDELESLRGSSDEEKDRAKRREDKN